MQKGNHLKNWGLLQQSSIETNILSLFSPDQRKKAWKRLLWLSEMSRGKGGRQSSFQAQLTCEPENLG